MTLHPINMLKYQLLYDGNGIFCFLNGVVIERGFFDGFIVSCFTCVHYF